MLRYPLCLCFFGAAFVLTVAAGAAKRRQGLFSLCAAASAVPGVVASFVYGVAMAEILAAFLILALASLLPGRRGRE